jgi:hypothetical protein
MFAIFGDKSWFASGWVTSIPSGAAAVVETFRFAFESNEGILFEDGSGVMYGG